MVMARWTMQSFVEEEWEGGTDDGGYLYLWPSASFYHKFFSPRLGKSKHELSSEMSPTRGVPWRLSYLADMADLLTLHLRPSSGVNGINDIMTYDGLAAATWAGTPERHEIPLPFQSPDLLDTTHRFHCAWSPRHWVQQQPFNISRSISDTFPTERTGRFI